jgi:hypothetical protein
MENCMFTVLKFVGEMDPKSKECDVLGDAVYNEGEN